MRHLEHIYTGLEGYADDGHRPRWVITLYMDMEPAFVNGRIVFNAED